MLELSKEDENLITKILRDEITVGMTDTNNIYPLTRCGEFVEPREVSLVSGQGSTPVANACAWLYESENHSELSKVCRHIHYS